MTPAELEDLKARLERKYIAPLLERARSGDAEARELVARRKRELEEIGEVVRELEARADAGDWRAAMKLTALMGGDVEEVSDPEAMRDRWLGK